MEDFKNLQETQLSSQPIFDGDVLHIFKDTIRLPNGKQATREYTVHHGAVCILPLLENGDVLLEHQFRYPMGEVITEIPAGKLDYIGEDPASAALRELREETGAVAGELIPLGRFYPTCAYSTEVIHMYLARQLTFGEREHPANQLPIQPPFQCQRGDSRGQTAGISGQQTDRQPMQGHASGKQRLERKKRRQRLQEGEAELQEPVQTVEAWLPQEIREQLRQRQARDLQNTAHPTSALHESRSGFLQQNYCSA